MKAATHTEVYRPFRGQVARRRLRFVPLYAGGFKTAVKRKLPLVLFFAPIAIATVIFSFTVYAGFAIDEGTTPSALGGDSSLAGLLGKTLLSQRAQQILRARDMIVNFHLATNVFALLVMTWFGAGLLAEDRRAGAHLLYFARPLSRRDYLAGKFLVIATFGVLAAVAPGLVICTVATFASPDWSFVRTEGLVIVQTVLFGLLSTLLVSSIVLCVSSLATRRVFAMIGVFGVLLLTSATGGILSALQRNGDFRALSPMFSLTRIAAWMFDVKGMHGRWDPALAWTSVAVTILLSWVIIAWRTRRLDVVG